MPVSSTVSVPYGRSFTSSNLGGRWSGTVAIDSEFAASGTITLSATVIRQTTWWIQFTGDLELLPNTLGARNDLVVTLTHPSAGSITGDISSYQTAASRDGTTSQANITARDTAAQSAWGTAVSDDTDALSITLSSASSGPAAAVGGLRLGAKTISKLYLGATELTKLYLGARLIFATDTAVPLGPEIVQLSVPNNMDSFVSDGTTLWLSRDASFTLTAYRLFDGLRMPEQDIELDTVNTHTTGIWMNNTNLYTLDTIDRKIYVYDRTTGDRISGREINFSTVDVSSSRQVYGLWSDGMIIWVGRRDHTASGGEVDNTLLAYGLSTRQVDTTKSIDLVSPNATVVGIWSDGTRMWVSDNEDGILYCYNLSNGNRISSRDITLNAANNNPGAIWSDGTNMWVADNTADIIYSYNLATGALRT